MDHSGESRYNLEAPADACTRLGVIPGLPGRGELEKIMASEGIT